MAKDSLPELELANVRTREGITDTVTELKRRANLPARTRLAVAKTKQRWHRDPTPLVAMGITGLTGVAAIIVGISMRNSPAGHLATPPASSAFTALLPFGTRGDAPSAKEQAQGGRKGRKARRKAAEEALEQDPAHKARVKQQVGIAAVQRRADKNRKAAVKRSKQAAKRLAARKG